MVSARRKTAWQSARRFFAAALKQGKCVGFVSVMGSMVDEAPIKKLGPA